MNFNGLYFCIKALKLLPENERASINETFKNYKNILEQDEDLQDPHFKKSKILETCSLMKIMMAQDNFEGSSTITDDKIYHIAETQLNDTLSGLRFFASLAKQLSPYFKGNLTCDAVLNKFNDEYFRAHGWNPENYESNVDEEADMFALGVNLDIKESDI